MPSPTRNLTLSIEPIDVESLPPGASQIGQRDFVSNVTPTSLSLARNYDSFYLNPDLEALLNTRGFSTKRPEIIGMFNYEAPLSAVTNGYGPTSEFLINPSGELFDMQCQLKQLRYNDASKFFKAIVGLGGDGAESFKIHDSPSMDRDKIFLAKSLVKQYQENKDTALTVLDYLASIYNAVSKFIDMQYLNREFNIFTEASTASPADETIFSSLPLMDPSLASTYVWNADPMNLEYFLRIFAGDAINESSSGMKPPKYYSKEATWVYGDNNPSRLVSGTWSMLTLINIAMGGLKGLSSPWETVTRPDTEYDRVNDFGKRLPGYLFFSTTVPLMLPFDFKYEGSVGQHSLKVGGSVYGASSLTSVFSNTLKAPLYNTSAESELGGLAKLAYFIGLDTLQGCQLTKNDATGMGSLAGVNVRSVKKEQYSYDIGDLIDKSMGRDVSRTLPSILENLPADSDNFTRRLLTFNEDPDGGDDRAAIESFTSSNFLLAEGVENSRNGRSYYCDEIVTKEISETTLRLGKLRSGLQQSARNLSDLSKLMFKKQSALRYNGQYFLKYGHDRDSNSRYSIPGDILTHLIKEIAESFKWAQSRESSWKHEIAGWDCIWYLIAAASGNNDQVFHKIVMLNLAWCEYQEAKISLDVLQDLADETIDYVLDHAVDQIKADYEEKDRGNGHWALYDNGVAAPDGDISRDNIEDHGGGGGTSSSYVYYPSTNSGLQLEREDGSETFDDVMKKGSFTREDLKSKLKLSILPNATFNPLLAPVRALRMFEHDLFDKPDRTGMSSDSRSYPYGFTARGFDYKSKVVGLCFLWRYFISQSLSCGLYFQKITTRSSGAGDSKHDYSVSSTWYYALIALNKRGLLSFINFADLYTGEESSAMEKVDPYTLILDLSSLGVPDVPMSEMNAFKAVDDFTEHSNQNSGYYQTFHHLRQSYVNIMKDFQSREINFIQTLRFIGQATDGLIGAATGLQQVIQDNDIERNQYNDVLEPIRSDPRYKSSGLLSITRDQLSLNRSLYDSFFIPNREHPYLPASKAIMTNQSRNLAAFLKESSMLDQPNNKRFIASIGMPSGLIESLRNRMMDQTGNLDYRHASIVEISIWKRDLLRENVLYKPKRYVFDSSRFLIYGRPIGTRSASNEIDDALRAPRSQTYSEIVNSCVFRKYTPSGNVYTKKGNAYGTRFYSEAEGVDTEEIIFNHMRDYYLKLFMRLSTGIDTSEDIFPFLEGNVFFDSVDPANQDFYEELAEMAKFMFVDIDSIETSLNYDRLLREIRRSLFMSSQKYRNRVLYPKVFERTFAILIDPNSFEVYTGSDFDPPVFKSSPETHESSPPSTATENIGPDNSLYHQYYATIGLKPAFEDAENGRIMYDNNGGYLGVKEITTVTIATDADLIQDAALQSPFSAATRKF